MKSRIFFLRSSFNFWILNFNKFLITGKKEFRKKSNYYQLKKFRNIYKYIYTFRVNYFSKFVTTMVLYDFIDLILFRISNEFFHLTFHFFLWGDTFSVSNIGYGTNRLTARQNVYYLIVYYIRVFLHFLPLHSLYIR